MTLFCHIDRQHILATLGVTATLERGGEFRVMAPQYQTPQTMYEGGDRIDQVNPFARADFADVQRLGIVTGENGDKVRIGGVLYRILSIEPERNGFCTIELGM